MTKCATNSLRCTALIALRYVRCFTCSSLHGRVDIYRDSQKMLSAIKLTFSSVVISQIGPIFHSERTVKGVYGQWHIRPSLHRCVDIY